MSARQVLIFVTAMLVSIGVLMVFSASISSNPEVHGSNPLLRHTIAVGVSMLGLLAAFWIPSRWWRRLAVPLAVLTVILLGLVLVPGIGVRINGARRWFRVGSMNFQPSELAKVAMIVFLAWFFSRQQDRMRSFWKVFLPALATIGMVCALVLKGPDFGTAALIGTVCLLMCFVAGVPKRYLAVTVLAALPAMAYLVMESPYRLKRLTGFLQIWEDPLGTGYHARQSLLSLGSGGVYGVGLGRGQQKLSYLPEANTDFIFGVIGEEIGLVGTLLVIGLFVAFFLASLRLMSRTRGDPFAFLVMVGLTAMIAIQATLNMAVVTATVPTKGLPLPLVSLGGSSMLVSLMSVGMLLGLSRRRDIEAAAPAESPADADVAIPSPGSLA